jgi:hypothetical protein
MTDVKDDVLKVAEYFNGLTLYPPTSQILPAAMSHVLVTLPIALAMQECIRSMADRLTTLTRERDEAKAQLAAARGIISRTSFDNLVAAVAAIHATTPTEATP